MGPKQKALTIKYTYIDNTYTREAITKETLTSNHNNYYPPPCIENILLTT